MYAWILLWSELAGAGEWREVTTEIRDVTAREDGAFLVRVDRGFRDGVASSGMPVLVWGVRDGAWSPVGSARVEAIEQRRSSLLVTAEGGGRPAPGDRVLLHAVIEVPAAPSAGFELAARGVDLAIGGETLRWEDWRKAPDALPDDVLCALDPALPPADVCAAIRWFGERDAGRFFGPTTAGALVDSWRTLGSPVASSELLARLERGDPDLAGADDLPYAADFLERVHRELGSSDRAGAERWTVGLERLAEATGAPSDRAAALLARARVQVWDDGDHARAAETARAAHELSPDLAAAALDALAVYQGESGDAAGAWATLQQAAASGGAGRAWETGGWAASALGSWTDAAAAFRECIAWHRQNGDPAAGSRVAWCQNGLGRALLELEDYAGAEQAFLEGFDIAFYLDNGYQGAILQQSYGDARLLTVGPDAAHGHYRDAALRLEASGHPLEAAYARMAEARALRMLVRRDDAVAALRAAVEDGRAAGAPAVMAEVLAGLGEIQRDVDDPRAAIALYEEALALLGPDGPIGPRMTCWAGIGWAKDDLEDADGAAAAFDEAVAAAGTDPASRAWALEARGRHGAGVADLDEAASLHEQLGRRDAAVVVLGVLADAQRAARDLEGAAATLDRAAALAGDRPRAVAPLLSARCRLLRDQGDVEASAETCLAAVDAWVALRDARGALSLGYETLISMAAARFFDAAVKTGRPISEGALLEEAPELTELRSVSDAVLAEVLLRMGRLDEAEEAARRARRTTFEAAERENELYVHALLSTIALERGDRETALTRAERAAALVPFVDEALGVHVSAWAALAGARAATGDAAGAVQAGERAVVTSAPGNQRVLALRARGEARLAAGDAAGGREDLEAAVAAIDDMTWPIYRDHARLALAEARIAAGDAPGAQELLEGIDGRGPTGDVEVAVAWRADLARAAIHRASGRGEEAERLTAAVERQARDAGAWRWVGRAAVARDPAVDPWAEAERNRPPPPPPGEEFRDTLAALEAQYPDLAERMAVPASELEAIQSDLGRGEAFVEPVVLPDRVGVVIVRKGRPIVWRETAIPEAEVNARISAMRAALSTPRTAWTRGVKVASKVLDADPIETSRALHDLVLAPASEDLAGAHTLIFAPSGRLRYVPFGALYDGERYLAETHRLALMTASGSVTQHEKLPRRAALLAMSNPDGSLPGASAEVESIRRSWGPGRTKVHDGAAATEEALRADVGGVQLLHLATHGYLREDEPRESYLLFAGPNGTDSRLTLREITLLPLDGVGLAVLSACETAVGDTGEGKEIAGLAYQLEVRGTAAVVASLWPVSDASTSALMTAFYAELARGRSRSEALRRAQAVVLANPETAHPYYWAPFVLIGDWR